MTSVTQWRSPNFPHINQISLEEEEEMNQRKYLENIRVLSAFTEATGKKLNVKDGKLCIEENQGLVPTVLGYFDDPVKISEAIKSTWDEVIDWEENPYNQPKWDEKCNLLSNCYFGTLAFRDHQKANSLIIEMVKEISIAIANSLYTQLTPDAQRRLEEERKEGVDQTKKNLIWDDFVFFGPSHPMIREAMNDCPAKETLGQDWTVVEDSSMFGSSLPIAIPKLSKTPSSAARATIERCKQKQEENQTDLNRAILGSTKFLSLQNMNSTLDVSISWSEEEDISKSLNDMKVGEPTHPLQSQD